MAAEREKMFECEVRRRRVKAGGGYEPYWKVKNVAVALSDADTEFRCWAAMAKPAPSHMSNTSCLRTPNSVHPACCLKRPPMGGSHDRLPTRLNSHRVD
jgi:hypothetical protein